MTEIEKLQKAVDEIEYPNGIIKVKGEITGQGFFPGAKGSIGNLDKISDLDIMILGQDQDSEKGFIKNRDKGKEVDSPTWRNLIDLLNDAKIDTNRCFFTNCIMGVRNTDKNTGISPAFKNTEYLKSCSSLLVEQLKIQKPKLIICLGLVPIKMLSTISKELLFKFIGVNSFKEIDEMNLNINKDIIFEDIPNFKSNVTIITHPSYSKLNQKIRIYNGHNGFKAEVEMLKHCISLITTKS